MICASSLLLSCERQEPAAASTLGAAAAKVSLPADTTVVDVRSAAEFEAGHVLGAINIPLDEITAHFDELPDPAKPIAVYCGTGERSAKAAAFLLEWGHEHVYDLGGVEAARRTTFEHRAAGGSFVARQCNR
jgi:rhodanese-related sulfurtransferase